MQGTEVFQLASVDGEPLSVEMFLHGNLGKSVFNPFSLVIKSRPFEPTLSYRPFHKLIGLHLKLVINSLSVPPFIGSKNASNV